MLAEHIIFVENMHTHTHIYIYIYIYTDMHMYMYIHVGWRYDGVAAFKQHLFKTYAH